MPYLVLNDGRSLHEVAVIVQYLADQVPEKNLAPANGSFERYKLQEWLNFISSEIHKSFGPLFNPATPAEAKPAFMEKLKSRLAWVDGELANRQYLMGDSFSVADAYLFTVTNWCRIVGLDISAHANLLAYRTRVGARPGVIAAMQAEGLIK